MNKGDKVYEKVMAVLGLLEGYALRVGKASQLVIKALDYLKAETDEMKELTEQLMLQALAEWGSIEKAIKGAKEQLTKKVEEESNQEEE